MQELILTTTTSAYDSGLLNHLLISFEAQYNYKVNVNSVGSGKAIELAKQGNCDVILVHDPQSEQNFINEGLGINRQLVMHNDFILVGPPDDPANIRACDTITEAFQKLAKEQTLFISRDDASGTDKREKLIWNKSKIATSNNILRTKSGMAETLAITSAREGYVLTDRATYLSKKRELRLQVLFEGDDLLLNVYHAIQVNPERFPSVNAKGAHDFINFLLGEGQSIIANFLGEEYNNSPFIPDGGRNLNEVINSQVQLGLFS